FIATFTTQTSLLSLPDALPISSRRARGPVPAAHDRRAGDRSFSRREDVCLLEGPVDLLQRVSVGGQLRERVALPGPRQKVERLRSEEHTSELQSSGHLVCRLLH